MSQPTTETVTIDDEAMQALSQGQHDAPFSVLGPHKSKRGFVVRTFQPKCSKVEFIDASGQAKPMARHGDSDLFVIELGDEPGAYQLQVDQQLQHDPYRFASAIGELDYHLFGEGTHQQLYKILGSHLTTIDGVDGVHFGVWAPNAKRVSVVGEFNQWDGRVHCMRKNDSTGIWDIFIPHLDNITLYKYEIIGQAGEVLPLKNDPFASYFEQAPGNASIVFNSRFIWSDDHYLSQREKREPTTSPIAIYEVHAGSWQLNDNGQPLSYRELAQTLVNYVKDNGFTHVELLPITEHPFSGSWGYQPIGLFAPTSRFGSPDDFRYFVDQCHANDIGVIIDWVPAHFPTDEHGLGMFDGTHLFEHADPRQGFHQDWETLIFNYGRREVANYLFSNAVYWIKEFHLDGLRVDAVASMLYLDYSREEGQWIPNEHGGRENLEAIAFLKRMNELVHLEGGITLAEESTSFPGVSHPTYSDGLGFTFKWNMGWMHDSLDYIAKDPAYRKYHQNNLTFGLMYAFSENFLLPISHDEVVYGKGALLSKMPGDQWQQFANLRAFFAYMYLYPGKKLMFMGCEIAQSAEWAHEGSVHWNLLENSDNKSVQSLVKDLNNLYKNEASLHEGDCHAEGFEWIDCDDSEHSVISFYRRVPGTSNSTIVICNFTPIPRHNYLVGVNEPGEYIELLNTDAKCYGGSGVGNLGRTQSVPQTCQNREHSLSLSLPPLSVIALQLHKAT